MNPQARELLTRIERELRMYSRTVDLRRSACPRLSVWEDAIADRFVEVVVRDGASPNVVVGARGRAVLADA